MLSIYDLLILAAYLAFVTTMGVVFRRFNRGSNDYFAGGFRMSWWLVGASSFISNFSCWTFTGAANIAYRYGLLVFGVSIVDLLGFLLAFAWFAPRFRQLRLVTAIDGVRLRFGRANEQIFNALGFVSSLATAAVWMVSLSIFLGETLGFPQVPVILVTGTVVIAIALLGGNWGVAASDFVQLILLMSVSVATGVLTLIKIGGISSFIAQIPEPHRVFFHPLGSVPYDWLYLATSLLTATYSRNNLLAATKYIGAKDGRHARLSALIPFLGFTLLPLFWFIPPLAAHTLAGDFLAKSGWKMAGEASYVAVCLKVLPKGMVGLMIAGMLSATIASMDVALNKNAGFFVKNVYQPLLRKNASDRELVLAGEFATLAFGLVITTGAVALAAAPHLSLFDAYLYLAAYIGVPFAVPLFMGMLVKRTPIWAAWSTAAVGIGLTIFIYNFLPRPIGQSFVEPVVGAAVYHYLVSNQFVATNLIVAPLAILFFTSTRLFYSDQEKGAYALQVAEFFRRMETPIDFEREVGGDNTAAQSKMIGRASAIYGALVLLLLFVPNPWIGRLGILGCGLTLLTVGGVLCWYSRRLVYRGNMLLIGLLPIAGLLLVSTGRAAPESPPAIFSTRDRWAAVGDSITQNGTYHQWMEVFYATRYPAKNVSLVNCGVSGDTLAGALQRFDWDVRPEKPTVATVFFGMNDVRRDLYGPTTSPEQKKAQTEALQQYEANLETLTDDLEKLGSRIQFITPSPYDDKAAIAEPNHLGVDQALIHCADVIRKIAAKHKAIVLDLHSAMETWADAERARNPAFTFTVGDRIHPTPSAHVAIAYWLLRAQGAPEIVSQIEIEAGDHPSAATQNVEVSRLEAKEGVIRFQSLAQALPWPIPYSVQAPAFVRDLSKEIVRIRNAPTAGYALAIDQVKIGEWSASELAQGVNLGNNVRTPQYLQADHVRGLIEKKADLMRQWRVIAQADLAMHIDPREPPKSEELEKKIQTWLESVRGGKYEKYTLALIERYRRILPKGISILAEVAQINRSVAEAAKPRIHTYEFIPITNTTSAASSVETSAPLAHLRSGHPRLLLTSAQLQDLKERASRDPLQAELQQFLIAQAEAMLSTPAPLYRNEVLRDLLWQARLAIQRIVTCGFAYRLTGDPRFADCARKSLNAICAFPNWDPEHFLDTAELSLAAAIGYDWLFDELSGNEKQQVRRALTEFGLNFGLRAYQATDKPDPRLWFAKADWNWNQVGNGGMLAAALALADENPAEASVVVSGAVRSLRIGMSPYAPDGAYPEGPIYWGYGTTYNVIAIAMLETALGSDFGLSASPGFDRTALYLLAQLGPNEKSFNYADSVPVCGAPPAYDWLARRFNLPDAITESRRLLQERLKQREPEHENDRFLALHALWLPDAPSQTAGTITAPLDWHFRGKAELALFRSAWQNPNAVFVGLKAGTNAVNHAHLDLGSFVLDADGVRWAEDLGSDSYNLSGYFGAQRFSYFRLNNFGHNTITLGDQLQDEKATAPIVSFDSRPERARAATDLSLIYAGSAAHIFRGVTLWQRKYVLVTDEVEGLKPKTPFHWHMLTAAKVVISNDGHTGELQLSGREMRVQILGPSAARFSVKPASPPTAVEKQNHGVSLLSIDPLTASDFTLSVLFAPGSAEPILSLPAAELTPPSTWR